MGANRMPADPQLGIPDLVRSLGDDSKRLLADEVHLARLEMKEAVIGAGRGLLWFTLAFAAGTLALVAFTLFFVTIIGRLSAGHMWIGAFAAAVLELALGSVLIWRGVIALKAPSYTFEETRESVAQLL